MKYKKKVNTLFLRKGERYFDLTYSSFHSYEVHPINNQL